MVSPVMFKTLDVFFTPAGWLYSYCGPYRDYLNWFGRKAKGRAGSYANQYAATWRHLQGMPQGPMVRNSTVQG